MNKITLSNDETIMMERFVQAAPEAGLIKKILFHYIADLGDIRNIDPKGNVGLQTCAALGAVQTLEGICSEIFPDFAAQYAAAVATKKISPWR